MFIVSVRNVLGGLMMAAFSPVYAGLEAYLSAFSAVQGGELKVHISSDTPTVDLKIFQIGVPDREVYSRLAIVASKFAIPAQAWTAGAQWSQSVNLTVDPAWASGLYRIALSANGQESQSLNFVVREDQSGSQSKILVLDNATTTVAYNSWGGKSTYSFNSTGSVAAPSVSLLRPGNQVSLPQELGFARWTQVKGIAVEYASMIDLHADASLLDKYSAVILVAHSEYWSKEMRDHLEIFLARGGSAIILGGNTMWWQVRIEGDQLVCYKSAKNDPLFGVDNARVTTNWYASPVLRPENSVTGVSWRHGGYVNSAGFYPSSGGSGGYTVIDPTHWFFQGTSLAAGDILGRKNEIVGYETDGALFNLMDGKPVVTGLDGSPLNFQILASAPAATAEWTGNATLGIYKTTGGGYVFNASTVYWANGLWSSKSSTIQDSNVSAITYNVLTSFGGLPPANDLIANAAPLNVVNGRISSSNARAGKELGEPAHAGRLGGASVWFTWKAASSGLFTFTTQGSSFDTLLAIYQSTDVNALTPLSSNNDDGSVGGASSVTINVAAGQTYFIVVDGNGGAAGAIVLAWAQGAVDSVDVPVLPPWGLAVLLFALMASGFMGQRGISNQGIR